MSAVRISEEVKILVWTGNIQSKPLHQTMGLDFSFILILVLTRNRHFLLQAMSFIYAKGSLQTEQEYETI